MAGIDLIGVLSSWLSEDYNVYATEKHVLVGFGRWTVEIYIQNEHYVILDYKSSISYAPFDTRRYDIRFPDSLEKIKDRVKFWAEEAANNY